MLTNIWSTHLKFHFLSEDIFRLEASCSCFHLHFGIGWRVLQVRLIMLYVVIGPLTGTVQNCLRLSWTPLKHNCSDSVDCLFHGFLPGLWEHKKEKQGRGREQTISPQVCGVNFFFQTPGCSETEEQDWWMDGWMDDRILHLIINTINTGLGPDLLSIAHPVKWAERRCGSRPRQTLRHTASVKGKECQYGSHIYLRKEHQELLRSKTKTQLNQTNQNRGLQGVTQSHILTNYKHPIIFRVLSYPQHCQECRLWHAWEKSPPSRVQWLDNCPCAKHDTQPLWKPN